MYGTHVYDACMTRDEMAPPRAPPPQEAVDCVAYLNDAWTPYHSVLATCKELLAAGFQEISERDAWSLAPGGKYFFTRNMSAVTAFAVGAKYAPGEGFIIIGAHTDSPCPKLKPNTKTSGAGFLQVRVQNYGGGLWYTWFDRDLGIAGRVLVRRGGGSEGALPKFSHELVKIDRPIMRIPSLAIHLDRTLSDGFKVNFQSHMVPVIATAVNAALGGGAAAAGAAAEEGAPAAAAAAEAQPDAKKAKEDTESKHHPILLEMLSEELGCAPGDIMDFELQLCDVQPSVIGGARREFIFSGRLDNLASCFASLRAMVATSSDASLAEETGVRMMVHFDHEEVGSDSAQGAGSSMTEDAMRRITGALTAGAGPAEEGAEERSRRASFCVSADMAHAVHPNYSDRHEPGHQPKFGGGVVVKHNANQRYATDAVTAFLFRELGERVGVPVQEFVVRSDLGCGSTIGPILSTSTGIRTVDVGAPQLSMHSVREMCGVEDIAHAVKHFTAVYEGFSALDKQLMVDGSIGNMCRPCGHPGAV